MRLTRRHRDIPGFVNSLNLHYSVRAHAGILLAASTLAGLLLSRLLLWMGMETPFLRFPIAVVAAYGFFLLFVEWWLHYIGIKRTVVDDAPDVSGFIGPGPHSTPGVPADSLMGGGGSFDGGGASAGFDDPGASQLASAKAEIALRGKASALHIGLEAKAQAGASVGDLASGAAGLGELAFPLVLLAVLVGFAVAAGWIITVTPSVLVETAVEVAVASGLIRSVSRTRDPFWFESLFSRTIWKALALAVSALFIGFAVRLVDPSADTIGEAVARLMSH